MEGNILDYIGGKYHTAIFTTFNFDINFFDSMIFPKLAMNNVKNIVLFVDSKEFEKAKREVDSTYAGKKYNVIPVKINSSFHPKITLLLGDDRARLLIGSFNQTRRAYYYNQEIYNMFSFDKANDDGLYMIQSAYHFLQKICLTTNTSDIIFNKLSSLYYLNIPARSDSVEVLDSFESSVFDKLKDTINEDIRSIRIAVPFYDDELRALSKIKEECNDIKLFIQNGMSTFPIEYNKNNNINDNIFLFKNIDFNKSDGFYHGKVMLFNTLNNSYILYGSSNCTLAALFKSFEAGGNVECNILAKGELGQYDAFFDEFVESKAEEFTRIIEEKNNELSVVYSLKTINLIDDTNIKVVIHGKKKPEKVLLNDMELEYEYNDNDIVIILPKNMVDTIFDITVQDEALYSIRCFYNDYTMIEEYRTAEKIQVKIPEYILYKNDNIMLSDLISVINCLPTEMIQLEKIKEEETTYRSLKEESESDDNTEDYVIDDEKIYEYAKKHSDNEKIKRILNHVSQDYYLSLLNQKLNVITKSSSSHNVLDDNSTESTISETKETDVYDYTDNQCKRLISKLIDKITYSEFIDELDYKIYKDYVGLTISYLDKYIDKFSEKGLLSYKKIIDYKYNLLVKLLNKVNEHVLDPEEEKEITVLTFLNVMEMNMFNLTETDRIIIGDKSNDREKDKNIEPKTKELLSKISKFSNSNNYDQEYEQSMILLKNKNIDYNESYLRKIFYDNLGYMNFSNIEKEIDFIIEGEKHYVINNEALNVTVHTSNINSSLKYTSYSSIKNVLKIIKLYSLNVESIKALNVKFITNTDSDISVVDYNYDLQMMRGKRTIKYSNVNKRDNIYEFELQP